jgi:hypothetical protein
MHIFIYIVLQCTIHTILNVHIFVFDSFCTVYATSINFVQEGQKAEKKVSYYILIFKAPTEIFYQKQCTVSSITRENFILDQSGHLLTIFFSKPIRMRNWLL